MDDAIAHWPALVKRVRFLSSLKQAELADSLGVDQCSVSRWERNLCVPETSVQKRLRDMLRRLEPAIDRGFVEQAPSIVIVSRMEMAGFVSAMSPAAAAAYQLTPKESRDHWIYDAASESARGTMEALDANPAWRHGEISMWRAVLRRADGAWARFTGSPIGNTGLFMCIAGNIPRPKDCTDRDFKLVLGPYDELCD